VEVAARGFNEWNSFACRGSAALRDPFELISVCRNATNQPACNQECADHASAPAVVQVSVADDAGVILPIEKRDGAFVDLVSPPTDRQTKLGTPHPLLFRHVYQGHLGGMLTAIICSASDNQSRFSQIVLFSRRLAE